MKKINNSINATAMPDILFASINSKVKDMLKYDATMTPPPLTVSSTIINDQNVSISAHITTVDLFQLPT